MKKRGLRNFARKFTGKHLYQSLFFNKRDSIFIKKDSGRGAFCEISRNTFFRECIRTTASEIYDKIKVVLVNIHLMIKFALLATTGFYPVPKLFESHCIDISHG